MPRYVAFLRAINVGGHVVKMGRLKQLFDGLGLGNVETFLASGNVIFESPTRGARVLEARLEETLGTALGYAVPTFLRTDAELAALAAHRAFPPARVAAAGAFNVGFVASPLVPGDARRLAALRTPNDDFHVHGREVYWLCGTRQSDSTFSNAVFEKALGIRATWRGMNTVTRLAAKLGAPKAP